MGEVGQRGKQTNDGMTEFCGNHLLFLVTCTFIHLELHVKLAIAQVSHQQLQGGKKVY